MPDVLIDLRRPASDGVDVGAVGAVECVPTSRREVDGAIVLPSPFAARLVDGAVTVDLAETGVDWCWRITERVRDGVTRYVTVPASEVTLDYADLVDVDPDTLDPWEPGLSAAYDAALALKANAADLGNAAGLDVGTTTGTVAAGDDSRITGALPAANLDTAATALDANPASALRVQQDARLSSMYARRDTGARVEASKNGVTYGTASDQTAAMQALINAVSTFGGGVIELDGMVRCDGQLTIPTTLSGIQLRQPPIRITGTVQNMPGSTFSETTPYTGAGGLDLRYAGRTDAGCETTVGSAIVLNATAVAEDRGLLVVGDGIPDQAWILAVDPGVSWTLYRPARATGTVSLTSFGGRIQSYGYGTLELDHLQLVSGAATSAPFVASTATTIRAHDNLFAGVAGKSQTTCDEDPFVLGGPGQGTRLTAGLTSGTPYTTLTVAPIPVGVTTGRRLLIGAGTPIEQEVTLASSATTGATTLTVAEFTPTANHPVSQSVYIGYAQSQINTTSWTVPSAPFQGYGTEISGNHFHRCRRISIGGFASSLSIRRNAWMHNCGSNLAAAPSTLTSGITAGATVTSLAVTALSRAVLAGDVIQTGVGDSSQEWVADADAAAGATSVSVTSDTADYTLASGTVAFNTAHVGAAIESYAIASEINAPLITENRIGIIAFSYAVRLSGATQHAYIAANDCQDAQASSTVIAGYRFDRRWLWGAQFNTLIPGLVGSSTVPVVDDWSYSDGRGSQTVLHHDQSRPARFSQGVVVQGETSRILPASPAATYTNTPKVEVPGTYWRWYHDAVDATLKQGTASVMRVRNSPAGTNAAILLVATGYGQLTCNVGDIRVTSPTGKRVYLGDVAAPTSTYVLSGRLYSPIVVLTPTATASRPAADAAGAGAMYYDSTLSKPVWSDGTVWRDAAGTEV